MFVVDVSDGWALTLDHSGAPSSPATPPRSPGLHMSDLIRAASIDAGLFEADDVLAELPPGQKFPQPAINRMCAGLAWEEWLAVRYRDQLVFHPGECMLDGVAGSPDAMQLDPNTGAIYIHEFKFTWKSTNKPTQRCWYWLAQIQAYILATGATGAFLHTYHVNGDYRGSGPIYRVIYLQFTPQELQENWAAVLAYRPQVEAALRAALRAA